jgi:transposase-like protein
MPAQRKYPDELRERAVMMVLEIRQREGRAMVSWPVLAIS